MYRYLLANSTELEAWLEQAHFLERIYKLNPEITSLKIKKVGCNQYNMA